MYTVRSFCFEIFEAYGSVISDYCTFDDALQTQWFLWNSIKRNTLDVTENSLTFSEFPNEKYFCQDKILESENEDVFLVETEAVNGW